MRPRTSQLTGPWRRHFLVALAQCESNQGNPRLRKMVGGGGRENTGLVGPPSIHSHLRSSPEPSMLLSTLLVMTEGTTGTSSIHPAYDRFGNHSRANCNHSAATAAVTRLTRARPGQQVTHSHEPQFIVTFLIKCPRSCQKMRREGTSGEADHQRKLFCAVRRGFSGLVLSSPAIKDAMHNASTNPAHPPLSPEGQNKLRISHLLIAGEAGSS